MRITILLGITNHITSITVWVKGDIKVCVRIGRHGYHHSAPGEHFWEGFIISSCHCAPDSVGTSFIFGFIRDADRDVNNQMLSVTVLNGGDHNCQFNLTYRDNYDMSIPLKTTSVVVASKDMTEIPVPSWYGWQYESPGMQIDSGPNQLLTATSSCEVMVIANNYDRTTHQGDSYLILPTSWSKAGSVFSFTLPPASDEVGNPGYQHISFIPTEKDVKGTLTIMGSSPLPFTAKVGDQDTTYFSKKTPQNDPHTYHVQADGPILVLAGVTCAGNYRACDQAAFMPHPLPTPNCYDQPYLDDDHPAKRINGFYLDVPDSCTTNQEVRLTGDRGNLFEDLSVPVTQQSSLTVVKPAYGGAIYFHAETAPSHITRYYDESQAGKQGAFIGAVPSLSQYIYGNSTFYTRNDGDSLEVICSIAFCISATVDGTPLMSLDRNFTTILIHGTNFYTISATIATKGFHTLATNSDIGGPYSYYVIGQTANATYGYIGAVNMPHVVPLPTTTPPITVVTGSTVTVPSVTATTQERTSSTSTPSISTVNLGSTTTMPIKTSSLPSVTVTSTPTATLLSTSTTLRLPNSTSALPATTTAPTTTLTTVKNTPSTIPFTTTPIGITSTPTFTPIVPSSTPSAIPSTSTTYTSTNSLSTNTPTLPLNTSTPVRMTTSSPIRQTTSIAQFTTTLINRLSTPQTTLPRSLGTSSRPTTTATASKTTSGTVTTPQTVVPTTATPSKPPVTSTATPTQPPVPTTATPPQTPTPSSATSTQTLTPTTATTPQPLATSTTIHSKPTVASTTTPPPVPPPSTTSTPTVASTTTPPPVPPPSTTKAPPVTGTQPTLPPPVTSLRTQPTLPVETTTQSSNVPLYMTALFVAYLTL